MWKVKDDYDKSHQKWVKGYYGKRHVKSKNLIFSDNFVKKSYILIPISINPLKKLKKKSYINNFIIFQCLHNIEKLFSNAT